MLPVNFLLFIQIILFLFITPGSPRVLIVTYAMTYGMKKTVWTALGDISANTVQMIVITFGISSILITHPLIIIVMKWLGVAYLLYLASELFRARIKNFNSSKKDITKNTLSFFRDGFMVAGLSPKALIFFGVILLSASLSNPLYNLTIKKYLKFHLFFQIVMRIILFIVGIIVIFVGLYVESSF